MKVDDIEHIVIRDHSYVAGTSVKPEVKVFVQTKTTPNPLNDSKLEAGQTAWMKWKVGKGVCREFFDDSVA